MKAFLILSGLLLSLPAWAQKITVTKVKGNQAVVRVSGGTLEMGQTYSLGGDDVESTMVSRGSRAGGSRNNVFGFQAHLSNLKSETSASNISSTSWGGDIRYCWNKQTSEYGVIGSFDSTDSGGGATMSFGGGGFFDYNMTPNRPSTAMIMGAAIDGQYIISTPPSGGTSSNSMRFYPSGFLKWFPLGNSTALRFDLGYRYWDTSTGGSKTKLSGIDARGGLSVYF
jgi:hypothetical protein